MNAKAICVVFILKYLNFSQTQVADCPQLILHFNQALYFYLYYWTLTQPNCTYLLRSMTASYSCTYVEAETMFWSCVSTLTLSRASLIVRLYITGATNTTVVMAPTGGPVIMQAAVFDSTSVAMTCPHCQAQISTSVSYRVGLMAWLICLGLAFFG